MPLSVVAAHPQGVCQTFDVAHLSGRHERAHLRHRGRCGLEFRAPVHVRDGRGLAGEVDDPVERRIAAAENREFLAVVLRGVAHAVVNVPALEDFRARHADAPRLERTHAAGDHHGAGVEARAENGLDIEAAVLALVQPGDFLAEVQRRIERRDLLQQPVDQFLRTADRQRRDVVDRLVRIQLGALAARGRERIDDVAASCPADPARTPGTVRRDRRR